MTQPRRRRSAPPPSKLTPAARLTLLALFGSAVAVAMAVVWTMYAMQPDPQDSGRTVPSPSWMVRSAPPSAVLHRADVGKLRELRDEAATWDDTLQQLQETVNADPHSDNPQNDLLNGYDACQHVLDQYAGIAGADPAAATTAGLPRSLAGAKATDCKPDRPDAVASLPTVNVSDIPAQN